MAPRIVVVADDLIWQTRLLDVTRAAAGDAVAVRAIDGLAVELASADGVLVDLTSRAYDGVAAIELAAARGIPVLAVGQHDDGALRKRALAAGAERVFAYRKVFEDGDATIGEWARRLGRGVAAP